MPDDPKRGRATTLRDVLGTLLGLLAGVTAGRSAADVTGAPLLGVGVGAVVGVALAVRLGRSLRDP